MPQRGSGIYDGNSLGERNAVKHPRRFTKGDRVVIKNGKRFGVVTVVGLGMMRPSLEFIGILPEIPFAYVAMPDGTERGFSFDKIWHEELVPQIRPARETADHRKRSRGK